jgi:predicted secreted protein
MLLQNPDSQNIELPEGDICLKINLPENPTTGYRWAILASPDNLIEGSHSYTCSDKRIPPAPGSGGSRLFEFWATDKVDGLLVLSYERSWEKDKNVDVRQYHIKT